ncbi:MAG: peptidoglycan bridge formation glycyltransferase FemA/FemB family protein [Anaerolineae bacterium]|nr:peptidoglycan bridge formation glycyltransferase FemA/FemB family protein [Anaerolineae bacterium]
MIRLSITELTQLQDWNTLLLSFQNPHFLQTTQWANVKRSTGWTTILARWVDTFDNVVAAALILKKSIYLRGWKLPFSILYLPRGPLLNWDDTELRDLVMQDIRRIGLQHQAIFVKIDPEVVVGTGIPDEENTKEDLSGIAVMKMLQQAGWMYSKEQVQFQNTVILDLTLGEEEILARMKQKTRYNIRLAEKKGVNIRIGTQADFETLYRMYAETSIRDGFVIRPREYYFNVWNTFYASGQLTPLIASVTGQDVAGLMLFHFGNTAWYVYGMSRDIHRNMMPTYLLQWAAIQTAREKGCSTYDLWGAPFTFSEMDSMWGVFRYKLGLGGQTIRTIGAWDLPIKRLMYQLYTNILPAFLAILRKKGWKQTRQSLMGS